MRATGTSILSILLLAPAACAVEGADDTTSETEAEIHTLGTAVPPDGECAHIIATRLSDFHATEFRGLLEDAHFGAPLGEHRVTATAYPQPCNFEPAQPPWRADDQVVTFARGENRLVLRFHADVTVGVDPEFDGDEPLVVRPGTRIATGRNGEDAAGPNYSLDGWQVKQIGVPPAGGGAAGSETVLFSLQGVGGTAALPYSPRGLARLPDGRFVAQVAEPGAAMVVYAAAGQFLASMVPPAGAVRWDNTDGLDAVDATHLVRTGWLNDGINCDVNGEHCQWSGLDVFEIVTVGGVSSLQLTAQIMLPELPGAPLNEEYPVGVTAIGGRYAVTTLPNAGGSRLVLLNPDGTVAAGPTSIDGSVEGLFDVGDGRIGGLEYEGRLRMFDGATAALRAGEELSYRVGAGVSNPFSLTWNDATGGYLALANRTVFSSTPAFDSATPLAIDLSSYVLPSAIEYIPGSDELIVIDRRPPLDPVTNTRIPAVDIHALSGAAPMRRVLLQGLAASFRPRSIGYIPARAQFVSHYRRAGVPTDPTLDAVVYTHNGDGTLAFSFDLAPLGFVRVSQVNYLRDTDELLITAVDSANIARLVVTDATGRARRSYRADAIAGVSDLAPIGTAAGDVGVIIGQPSEFVRIARP